MALISQKKLLILLGTLLFAGFLFFIPQGAYAASVFTAGWYEDNGTEEIDASCPADKWRVSIELRNDLGEPLLADKLTIRALWYAEGTDIGIEIYRAEQVNLTSHILETDCVIDAKSSDGTIVLEVTAEESGYYKMLAANNPRTGGLALNQRIWKKTLYLTPLAGSENANIVYLFPENYQWISGRPEHSEMKTWVNKTPLPDNIAQVNIEIQHVATGQKISLTQATNIAEGEVVFSLPALTEIGQYRWRVKSMRSTPSVFYNENTVSFFNFDPNPPIIDYLYAWGSKSGKMQAPYVYTRFEDLPLPSSGMCRVEIYLNDGPGTPLELVNTCLSSYCSYTGKYEEYLESKTYTYYVVGYDCVGNETKSQERSFTIGPINPSWLRIRSSVDNTSVTGVPFGITNITNVVGEGEFPATGTYATDRDFEGTVDKYTVTVQAPDSHNGRPFSFWLRTNTCYTNPWSRTVSYGYSYTYRMHFGASRFMLYDRSFINQGSMSDDLILQILQIPTRVEQIGGTPGDLLGPTGYFDQSGSYNIYKTVAGEINDLALRFYDSEDGILKFSDGYTYNWSCIPDPLDGRQCQGSIIYSCGRITPRYSIERTVRVEGYLGSNPVEGVAISGSGGMQSGTTGEGGYYSFSSTADPNQFTGTLRAPEVIIDGSENEVEFGYWTGCESVSADGLGCYIGTGVTWFYNINAAVRAHYTSSPDPEMPFLSIDRILTGTGDGTITGPSGICCGCVPVSTCSNYFATGTVILTATPAADSYFVGWTGACAAFGTNPTCTLSMDSDKQAWAGFAPKPVLTVNITGNGTVDSNPAGISCVGPGACSASFNPSSTVDLIADPDPSWEFTEWTGDVTTTSPTCSVFMNRDKTVNALFESVGPTAAMGCQIVDCGGPGCQCDGSWVTYHGVYYKLLNESTLPVSTIEYTSNWHYNGTQIGFPGCNHGSPPLASACDIESIAGIPVGSYNLRLVVEDEYGASSTAIQPITVRSDISADFDCSLDGATWQDCTSITVLTGQTVYFRDTSTPSEGAAINNWLWEKGDGAVFSGFASGVSIATTTLITTVTDTVRLTVWDDIGRSDSEAKTLTVTLPLPEYREVAPIGRQDNFLVRLGNIIARF